MMNNQEEKMSAIVVRATSHGTDREVCDLLCSYLSQSLMTMILNHFCKTDSKNMLIKGFSKYFYPVNDLIQSGLFDKDRSLGAYVRNYLMTKNGNRKPMEIFLDIIKSLSVTDNIGFFILAFSVGIISDKTFDIIMRIMSYDKKNSLSFEEYVRAL